MLCFVVFTYANLISTFRNAGGGYTFETTTSVNPTYQFFQPSSNTITANQYIPLIQNTNPINLFPFVTTLPKTNSVMMISGNATAFYQ